MPPARFGETLVPANPYDARQMVDYLAANPSESKALIWTLNLELTPIYAVEPVGPFGHQVYNVLCELLTGEVEAEHAETYIQRVSVPGLLSGRTARLFSGQIVPVIELGNVRGLYGWRTNALIKAALEAIGREKVDEAQRPPDPRGVPQPGLLRPAEPRGHLARPGPELLRDQRLPGRLDVHSGRRRGHGAGHDHRREEPDLPARQRLLGREAEVLRPGEQPPGQAGLPVYHRRQRLHPGHAGRGPHLDRGLLKAEVILFVG